MSPLAIIITAWIGLSLIALFGWIAFVEYQLRREDRRVAEDIERLVGR